MNKKKLLFIFLTGAALLALALFYFDRKYAQPQDQLVLNSKYSLLGLYDIEEGNINPLNDSFTHVTLKWFSENKNALTKETDSLKNLQAPLFIHLEIYNRNRPFVKDKPVLDEIISGVFDDKIKAFAQKFSSFKQPLLLSINEDMELPLHNYPWQFQDSKLYNRSFAHISNLIKINAPAIKIVWAPSGYPGVEDVWPGNETMNYNAIKLSNLPEVKDGPYAPYASVQEMLRRKILRMRFFQRPVLLIGIDSLFNAKLPVQTLQNLNGEIQQNRNIYYSPAQPLQYDSVNAVKANSPLVFGVYDPDKVLVKEPKVTAEHIFTNFKEVRINNFKKEFDQIMQQGHQLILTFEPWRNIAQERDDFVIDHIATGLYDSVFKAVLTTIANAPQQVYLRWGHEMEIPVNRYPWQLQDPVPYIKAFRHIRTLQQQIAPNVKMVWGPAGDRGSIEWYPGDDAVDLVSIAIYGLPDKNIEDHNQQQSFSTIFKTKLHRMRLAHKRLFITEFGVKGPQAYKQKWLADAADVIKANPVVTGINYFNFKDVPKAWGNIEAPDWSITKETYEKFMSALYAPANN